MLKAVPYYAILLIAWCILVSVDLCGAAEGLGADALASAIGYVIRHTALPHLCSTTAATVRLSVPAIATLGEIVVLWGDSR